MRYSKCKLYVKKKEKENYKTLYYTLFNYIYRVRRENFDTAHRKVDGIEMKKKSRKKKKKLKSQSSTMIFFHS